MRDQSAPIDNRSMPPGAIIPELGYGDLDAAVAWLCAAFGYRERLWIFSQSIADIDPRDWGGAPGEAPE